MTGFKIDDMVKVPKGGDFGVGTVLSGRVVHIQRVHGGDPILLVRDDGSSAQLASLASHCELIFRRKTINPRKELNVDINNTSHIVSINLKDIAEKMRPFFQGSVKEGWTNALVETLEEKYGVETSLTRILKDGESENLKRCIKVLDDLAFRGPPIERMESDHHKRGNEFSHEVREMRKLAAATLKEMGIGKDG